MKLFDTKKDIQNDEVVLLEFGKLDILAIILLTIFALFIWQKFPFFSSDLHFVLNIIILLPISFAFASLLVCDAKYLILPNIFTYFLIGYSAILNGFFELFIPLNMMAIGLVLGFLFPLCLRYIVNKYKKSDTLGLGDVKLLAGIGALYGPYMLSNIIFVSSIIGIIYYVVIFITEKNKLQHIPYGSCLSFVCIAPSFFIL